MMDRPTNEEKAAIINEAQVLFRSIADLMEIHHPPTQGMALIYAVAIWLGQFRSDDPETTARHRENLIEQFVVQVRDQVGELDQRMDAGMH